MFQHAPVLIFHLLISFVFICLSIYGNLKGYIQVNLRHYGANPSPAAYQHHNFDHAIRERYGTSKMSTSNAKSDVDWKIYRASSIPGLSQVKSCLQLLCEDLVDPNPCVCDASLWVCTSFFSSGIVCCFNFFSLSQQVLGNTIHRRLLDPM
jgi:hypothetical protein